MTTGTMAMPRVTSRRAQFGSRRCRKPSITIWPASVAVTVELRPEASSAMANSVEAMPRPSSGDSSSKAWPISATSAWPLVWNVDGRDDQDRGVDEQRQHQRDGGVRRRPFDRVAAALVGARIGAGLHDRGVQIEVMRHHRRADDADRDVEHLGIGDDLGRRHKAAQHRGDRRRGGSDLDRQSRPR